MSEFIDITQEGWVRTIKINRPKKKNALLHEMYTAMAASIEEAQTQDDVRVVVLTGEGDFFTAGNDLVDFSSPFPQGEKLPVLRFLDCLVDAEKPLFAAVNGPAVGIGLTMLLHCDFSFSSESANFRAPFPQIGLVPEAGSSLILPKVVGTAWANDILLGGRILTSAEALQIGLVSRVYPDAELLTETAAAAKRVAEMAPVAMVRSKSLIRMGREEIKQRMAAEMELFAAQLMSDEFAEAASAIFEKRKPNFG